MNNAMESLARRREQVEAAWQRYVDHPRRLDAGVRHIGESWRRSRAALAPQCSPAPLGDPAQASDVWQHSAVRHCAQREIAQLQDLVAESDCVAAISDPAGRLLWTRASPHMRDRAEEENFVAGGDWREGSAGTNAVGLCLATRKPVTVFSAEHYRSSLHDWVCYAAPIIHPVSGQLLGVLDLSSTWDRYTPLGRSAISGIALAIAQQLPAMDDAAGAELIINFLGLPCVYWRGEQLPLSLRHCEILCLLALHSEGLSLDGLHAALYGDAPVTQATLKSEISTLRSRLGGCIASRPYRLTCSVEADFLSIWDALRGRRLACALRLYRDSLLPASNAPEIEQWRHCIDALMGKNLDNCTDLQALLLDPHLCRSEMVRERVTELAG